jgi:D-glycero-alpha-D-manno-heptose-7-phosphate kinase
MRTPLVDKVSARYKISETVERASDIKHTRIRAALMDMGIEKGIEIGSFASLPAQTGLGSSSTFSVALIKGLLAYQGKKIDARGAAEAASRLEIELLNEPIGKQDQYAAAFGGMNVFEFRPNGEVGVAPVLLDYKKRLELENHLLLFYTGLTRPAASVLTEEKANIDKKFETMKEMSDSVLEFSAKLLAGDMPGMGKMLHDGWLRKKSLASTVSNSTIDEFYNAGMSAGAWGGKIVGAGGGGCVMFLAPLDKKPAIREAVAKVAAENDLMDFKEIPVKFVQAGAEVLFNGDQQTSFA